MLCSFAFSSNFVLISNNSFSVFCIDSCSSSILFLFSSITLFRACPSLFIRCFSLSLCSLKLFINVAFISSIFSAGYSLLQVGQINEFGSNSNFVFNSSSHFLYNSCLLDSAFSTLRFLSSNSASRFLFLLSNTAFSLSSFIVASDCCLLCSVSSFSFNVFNSFFAAANWSAVFIFSLALA